MGTETQKLNLVDCVVNPIPISSAQGKFLYHISPCPPYRHHFCFHWCVVVWNCIAVRLPSSKQDGWLPVGPPEV
eukprot:Awhi_evm2s7534